MNEQIYSDSSFSSDYGGYSTPTGIASATEIYSANEYESLSEYDDAEMDIWVQLIRLNYFSTHHFKLEL